MVKQQVIATVLAGIAMSGLALSTSGFALYAVTAVGFKGAK